MTQIFDTDITLTDEQQQLLQVIKHHYIMQDQFNQLTKHVETIYERIKKLEQALANKILS